MENKRTLIMCIVFLFVISLQPIMAQIDNVSIAPESAKFEIVNPDAYFIEIAGPNGYYFKNEVEHTNAISISNQKTDGTKFSDGLYQFKVTPILKLSEAQRKTLTQLRQSGDAEKLAAYRVENKLPESVETYNVYFSIRNGEFVTPDQKEAKGLNMPSMSGLWQQDHPALYASVEPISIDYRSTSSKSVIPAMDNTSADDQVFVDDVIVQGSICIGVDCVNGENFGFDTQRLKENNLRIHFDDTSASASFPGNDWRITINDSSNGGASYFGIEDATAGTNPFRVMAGAGNNALYVSNSGGNVGMGTSSPVVELHIADGDSPTLRLEQNGANGWTPQTWDVAGNETNFFVRDVTNGSKLPFKIKPGAADNSVYIAANSNIGLGTANPTHKLQVESGNIFVKSGNVGINADPSNFALNVLGKSQFEGTTLYKGDVSYFLQTGTSFLNAGFATVLRIDATNARVGIGTAMPSHELEVCGTIATTAATVTTSITCSSDIRFKKNITALEGSLEKLMRLRGVNYDWKVSEFPEKNFNETHQIGFIAQEMEALFPELVITDAKGYKAVDYSKITPVLVEAIKEQQAMINAQKEEITALQSQLSEVAELKAQLASISAQVSALNNASSVEENSNEAIGEKE